MAAVDKDQDMAASSRTSISIVGAGIAGLALGRCLLQRGIRATIFERDSAQAFKGRYNYGVTLHPWAYRPLIACLALNETDFRKRVAVDGALGGSGIISGTSEGNEDTTSSFRANRNRLEQLLAEGLDVRWDCGLKHASCLDRRVELDFGDGKMEHSDFLVGADGPHSTVRPAVSPTTSFKVLPYAVYNGKRRMDRQTFDTTLAGLADESNVIEHQPEGIYLKVSIDDRTAERVSLSWTFSRPPLHDQQPDALYRPDRAKEEAKQIPEELFAAISNLNLDPPVGDIFDSTKMKEDRMLNWLMRSMLVPQSELDAAAENGMLLVGDCVHGTPILGGDGANQAMLDAIELTDVLAKGRKPSEFYNARYPAWEASVENSEKRLLDLHPQAKANL